MSSRLGDGGSASADARGSTDAAPGEREWTDEGLLGASDPAVTAALDSALVALAALDPARRPATVGERRGFADLVATQIAPRNLAGLADPRRRNLYPVDLEALADAACLLGMTAGEVRAAIPRLVRASL